MDRRLPHRLREVRQRVQAAGGCCDSDSLRKELCRLYPEYVRLKQQPLRRLITQELSIPLESPAAPVLPATKAPSHAAVNDGGEDGRARKKRKRRVAFEPSPSTKPEAGVERSSEGMHGEDEASAEGVPLQGPPSRDALSDSLRRMYQPPQQKASATGSSIAPRDGLSAARNGRSAREHVAMASGFAPEERPEERLEDLGGIDNVVGDLRQLVVYPLAHPEIFTHLGVRPPTGVLLHGPPGSGKSKLAHALAGTLGVPFFKVAATEIVSGMSGESEAKIRQLFQAAMSAAPSLLFLDEVDSITPRRDSAGREMERRIVAQLLTCMDDLQSSFVVVLGATNRPDALDPALRRAGRFDREIAMGIPDEAARMRILEKMVCGMRLAEGLDLTLLAGLTPGFVGADLSALTKEAALHAVTRSFEGMSAEKLCCGEGAPQPFTEEELSSLAVEMADFHFALTKVQPSARREGFTTIPDVSWKDVGALDELRGELDAAVCEPIRKAKVFKRMGLTVPAGVLLFGPPGCGKTLLAKATANASGANFIAIKGPELLNKYVGESERGVRLVFQRALSSAPCVVFFDELDSMVPRRSAEGSTSAERVVNQMLTEMDGVQDRSQVFVIAATNRPDIIDPAMLRPGRLDKLLFVPLPSEAGRLDILRTHAERLPLAEDVDLPAIARGSEGFSGADLAALVREAAMSAIRGAASPAAVPTVDSSALVTAATSKETEAALAYQDGTAPEDEVRVTAELFARARKRISASVGIDERREYEALAMRICSGFRGISSKSDSVGSLKEATT